MRRLFLYVVLIWSSSINAVFADDSAAVNMWYQALKNSDGEILGTLMTDDARIFLNHLDVVQTRAEFIGSLDIWEDVAKDLEIEFVVDRLDEERLVAVVCYTFPDNAFTNRETFSFDEGKIFLQVQEREKSGC